MHIQVRLPGGTPISDEELEWWYKNQIEWCCPGRHGVIRNVPLADCGKAEYMLGHYFGAYPNDGLWWRKGDRDGFFSVEFTHQCKVSPPPTKPWEWCGKTLLFADWKASRDAERQTRQTVIRDYPLGTLVQMNLDDTVYMGQIIRHNQRTATIEGIAGPDFRVPWHCFGREVTKFEIDLSDIGL